MILASPAPAATPAAEKAAGAALTRDSSTTVPKAPVAGSSDAQNAPIPAAATPWEVKSVQEWYVNTQVGEDRRTGCGYPRHSGL